MNKMATRLDNRIVTAINQKNELETVLWSMREGVVAIDTGESIMSMNPLTVDVTLLEQALLNLLNNAIKYSKEGSRVEIRAEKRDGMIAIHIRDYGGGIAKRNRSRLFERFYRVDKARSRQLDGTGLGLAIVKHIVQAHEGDIKVESKLGEGSTFSIYLP